MAERLESGRVELRTVNSVPMQQIVPRQVDYQTAAREEARYAGTMAELLDRMGASINKQAALLRQEEALRFAAENPPTPEQLQLAKEGMPSAIPGLGKIFGDFTYYGQALKKARSLQLSAAFEQEGLNELVKIQNDVKNGVITADQAQQKIATINKGYTDSLAKNDGDAAIKFNATFATHGNTVLKAAYEEEAKRIKAQNTIKVRDTLNNIKQILEETVSQGEYIDPRTKETYSVDVLVDSLRSTVSTQALALGDAALHKEVVNEFDKEVREAKINAVTRYVLTTPGVLDDPQLTNKIMTGQLDKMSGVMHGLLQKDMDAVAKINANVEVARNRREAEKKQEAANRKQADLKEFLPLYDQALQMPEGSAQRKKVTDQIAVIAMRNPDVVPLGVLKDLRDPPKGEGNAGVEFNLLRGIYEGRITSPDQIWSMTRQGLSTKQAVAALKLLNREDKQDQNELDSGISKRAGIPVIPGSVTVIDPKGAEFKRRQELMAQAKDIEARMIREGKVPTPRMILSEIDDGIAKQRNSEGAKAARKQLDDVYGKKPWINGTISRQNLPALKQKAGNDINKQREVTRIEQLLNQAGE